MVHAFAASFHRLRREVQATQARAEAAVALSTTQEFPMWLAWGLIYRGWSLTLQGQGEEGILQIRQRLAGRQAIGGLEYPRYLALLAEAYGKAGRVEERLAALAAARAIMDTTGERL
jgi:adenylate cyclase